MTGSEQRKNRRFDLRLPIELIRLGTRNLGKLSETRNVSSGGVLFGADSALPIGEPVEYSITLPTGGRAGVRLHCVGKIVRLDGDGPQDGQFETAATMERYEFIRP